MYKITVDPRIGVVLTCEDCGFETEARNYTPQGGNSCIMQAATEMIKHVLLEHCELYKKGRVTVVPSRGWLNYYELQNRH